MKYLLFLALSLLCLSSSFAQTMWYEHVIRPDDDGAADIQRADINNDGRMDLLIASRNDDRIAWFENLDNQLTFVEHVVDDDFDDARRVRPADFNGDGHIDLITQAQFDHEFRLFWNLGDGAAWDMEVIGPEFPSATEVEPVDLDNDGDIDILITEDWTLGGLIWHENIDQGSSWVMHQFDWGMTRISDFEVADMDDDGDLDIVTCGAVNWDDEINWFENLGGGLDWTHHPIAYGADADQVRVGDLTGDGTPSVAAATDDYLAIWHGQLLNGLWELFIVEDYEVLPYISLADMDADGDLDLSYIYHDIPRRAWLENRGTWNLRKHQICYQISWPDRQGTFDLTGDGYPEFVESRRWDGPLVVRENNLPNVDFAVSVTPKQLPVNIRPNGSNLVFHWSAWNRTADGASVDLWGEIRFTSGELVRAFNVHPDLFLPAGQQRVEVRRQYVPYNLPTGEFYFIANLGTWPDQVVAADTFDVTKLPRPGADLAGDDEFAVLADGDMSLDCTPNPFNAMTTVRVALPEAAELRVAVYNVNGQQVAELVNGSVSAGLHAYTFDATHLASGLYFVRATVPGQLNLTRKLMLVR